MTKSKQPKKYIVHEKEYLFITDSKVDKQHISTLLAFIDTRANKLNLYTFNNKPVVAVQSRILNRQLPELKHQIIDIAGGSIYVQAYNTNNDANNVYRIETIDNFLEARSLDKISTNTETALI